MSVTSTPTLDLRVTDLKNRLAAAERARLRGEGERDAAAATAAQARAALAAEFGVTTVTEAQTVLKGLETELAAQLEQIATTLDEVGL